MLFFNFFLLNYKQTHKVTHLIRCVTFECMCLLLLSKSQTLLFHCTKSSSKRRIDFITLIKILHKPSKIALKTIFISREPKVCSLIYHLFLPPKTQKMLLNSLLYLLQLWQFSIFSFSCSLFILYLQVKKAINPCKKVIIPQAIIICFFDKLKQ